MIDPVNAGAAWNGDAEPIIPALRSVNTTTDFALGLMVANLRLAMDIGNEVGAPMLVANAVCGLICSNELGPKSNLDAISRTIESMAGIVFTEHA